MTDSATSTEKDRKKWTRDDLKRDIKRNRSKEEEEEEHTHTHTHTHTL